MDELMPVWMAGTQRRSFSGDVLAETALRSVSALAGRVLEEAVAGPPDKEVDERVVAPRGTLGQILEGDRLDCLAEWLDLCRGRRIHPALLPQALTLGKGAGLLEAAGPRGLWLAPKIRNGAITWAVRQERRSGKQAQRACEPIGWPVRHLSRPPNCCGPSGSRRTPKRGRFCWPA